MPMLQLFALLLVAAATATELQCGYKPLIPMPIMLGGAEAAPGQYPWMVSIQLFDYRGWAQNCGGSIIAPNLILTAAHCVPENDDTNENNRVVAGCVGRAYDEDEAGCQKIEFTASDTVRHPDYRLDDAWYIGSYDDIALIRLKQPFNFTEGEYRGDVGAAGAVGSICLPDKNGPNPSVGEVVNTAGWGYMEDPTQPDPGREELLMFARKLKSLPQIVRHGDKCKSHFANESIYDDDKELCLGSDEKYEGVCNGDSGGPVMIERNGRYFVVGIAAYLKLCGRGPEYPTVFTRVSHYRDWIDAQV